MLIDTTTKQVRKYVDGLAHESEKKLTMDLALPSCQGRSPLQFFAHFTGRGKPWMIDVAKLENSKKNEHILKWAEHLDALKLPVNSSNIFQTGFGSPLGFFNAKFPKGGYKEPSKKL
jgi:lipopolysaccharide biosynthesis glycosyltransferase